MVCKPLGNYQFYVSVGAISYYLAKGIIKYNKQLKLQLQNEPEFVKQIDELAEESKRVVNEISPKKSKWVELFSKIKGKPIN